MKRDIEWKDKTEDGVKRTVRVKFPGQGVIKWQFKRADEEMWDYDTPPSDDDWQYLVSKVEGMYNRNRCAHRDLELRAVLQTLELLHGSLSEGPTAEELEKEVSKHFTEQIIVAEIVAQLIEHRLQLPVVRKFNLAGTFICFHALKNGSLDMYVEYTGTGLAAILKQPLQTDPRKVFRIVEHMFRERWNLVWLKPWGFNNTYALAMRKAGDKATILVYRDGNEVELEVTLEKRGK